MNASKSIGTLLCLALLTSACGPLRPRLTRWHDQLSAPVGANPDELDFGVFGLNPTPEPRGFRATDLTERGQAALVQALGGLTKDPRDLLGALGRRITPPAVPPGDVDMTVIDRRLVFSVTHMPLHPADRLHMITMRLLPNQAGVQFQNWSLLATKYETINLGSLTFDQKDTTKLETGLAPGVIEQLKEPKASLESVRNLKEEVALKAKYAALSGRLATNEMFIFEKGAPGVDLTGVIAVDVTLQVPQLSIPWTITYLEKLFDTTGTPTPRAATFRNRSLNFPVAPDRITGCAELVAYTRRVCGGGTTMTESDDCAILTRTVKAADVVLVPELRAQVYQVADTHGRGAVSFAAPVSPLAFLTLEAAEEFLRYLQLGRTPLIGPAKLVLEMGGAIDVDQLRVQALPLNRAGTGRLAGDACGTVLQEKNSEQTPPYEYEKYQQQLKDKLLRTPGLTAPRGTKK